MIARITGAATRALLVAMMVITPALMLRGEVAGTPQMVVLIALMAALFTFVEYAARSPSIVEFREASPLNRLRFLSLALTVLLVTIIWRDSSEPTLLSGSVVTAGAFLGQMIDVPLSPLRMLSLMLPEDAGPAQIAIAQAAAGLAFCVAAITLAIFFGMVRLSGWPGRGQPFNLWINLPLFDPASGEDLLAQLKRDARVNIGLGLLLPFLIPVVVKLTGFLLDPTSLEDRQTLIWTVTAWAFLPASTIIRGLALRRIAEMIEAKRHRARDIARKPVQLPA